MKILQSALIGVLVIAAVLYYVTGHHQKSKQDAAVTVVQSQIETCSTRWFAALASASNTPLFTPQNLTPGFPAPGGGDFGALINPLLPDPNKKESVGNLLFGLKDEDMKRIKDWDDDWINRAAEAANIKADLSFLARLKEFEVWRLDEVRVTRAAREGNLLAAQFPSGLPLIGFMKLRLLKVTSEADAREALMQNRDLARLFFSAEHLPLAVQALDLLKAENLIRARWQQSGYQLPLPPVSEEKLEQLRFVLNGWGVYLSSFVPVEKIVRLDKGLETLVGICHGVNYQKYRQAFEGPHVDEEYPGPAGLLKNFAARLKDKCRHFALYDDTEFKESANALITRGKEGNAGALEGKIAQAFREQAASEDAVAWERNDVSNWLRLMGCSYKMPK